MAVKKVNFRSKEIQKNVLRIADIVERNNFVVNLGNFYADERILFEDFKNVIYGELRKRFELNNHE